MDIEKEREAFEAWHYNQYLLENPNIDISNAKYIYDYAHKNVLVCQLRESHFTAWQAAKAHEAEKLKGCVVVPVEPTARMMDCGSAAKFEHDAVGDIWNAMLEAVRGGNE